jgi:hypothetical protein
MIEFTCPGCLHQCVANGAFAGRRAQCAICGAFIRIPTRSGETALLSGPMPVQSAGRGPRALPPKPSVHSRGGSDLGVFTEPDYPPGPDEDSIDLGAGDFDANDPAVPDSAVSFDPDPPGAAPDNEPDDNEPELIVEEAEGDEPVKPARAQKTSEKPRKPKKKQQKISGSELDGKLEWEDYPPEDGPAPEEKQSFVQRNRKLLIYGGSVAASFLIVLVIVLSGGEKQPKVEDVVQVSQPPQPPPQPPPPAPKKEEKKVEPPKPPLAPEPREGGEPVRFTAPQLVAERFTNPVEFDRAFRHKLLVVRGTFARLTGGVAYLAERPNDPGIACVPPVRARKGPTAGPPQEFLDLKPGQAVEIRGWYSSDLQLVFCRVVTLETPADQLYRDREVELTGTIWSIDPDSADKFPSLVFDSFLTDSPISVRCLFRLSERQKLTELKVGQPVAVRGRCEGRSFGIVQLHNCLIVEGEAPVPGVIRTTVDKFTAAYEKDLLPFPRPDMSAAAPSVVIGAEPVAGAYTASIDEANTLYRNKLLTVKGTVTARTEKNTVILETGTRDRYQLELVFTPDQFARVPTTIDRDLEFRGVCTGVRGKYVRLENCKYHDSRGRDSGIRITEGYFPLEPGRELVYDVLRPHPGDTAKDHPITRIRVKFVEPDLIQVTPLRAGVYPKGSLFGDEGAQPKWKVDLTVPHPKQKPPAPDTTQVRVTETGLESRPVPPAPRVPGPYWDPVLKWGARKGETWTGTLPDGREGQYKVVEFGRDALGRKTVEILRVAKNPKDPKLPADPKGQKETRWEEATLVYTHGIGEVRRVITMRSSTGSGVVTTEMRLVESESTGLGEPKKGKEPRKAPDPPTAPDPLAGKDEK